MKSALISFILLFSLTGFSSAKPEAAKANALCEKVGKSLKPADILFLDIDQYLFRKVAEASQSWTSHVGVAIREDNQWMIYESVDPVSKKTPLCDFLSRTRKDHVAIRRMKEEPSAEQLKELTAFLKDNMGKKYHFGFDYNSEKLFCSKLVYKAYKKVFNLELGSLKTFKQMLAENPNGKTWFWRLWFFGSIPWERVTVTPHDQLIDEDLTTVLTWEDKKNIVL